MQRVARAAQSIARLTVALIVLLSVPVGGHAQAPRKDPRRAPPMGWDGRPVTRTCHADASDLQGLKATLIEHEKARIGFKNKIRHGVFSGGELSGGRIGSAAPASLVEMISRHLSEIQASGETAALVYDIGISGQQYALCVWLFSAKGMEAAVTAPITEQSPFRLASAATMVRRGLDVEGRSAARAPQLRLGQGAEQPSRERERASEQVTEEAWSLLMPDAISAKLRGSSAKRLLILPVSDIGFVPFAALPLDRERLIDRFALVLLPDVEALLDLSSEARPWRSEREMRNIVVGDPDLSQDRRWNFPALAGARSEAVEVAALVGEQPLLGQEATKTHVLDRLKGNRNASLIYFATHALSDAVNPMDGSFLALAGDHLYGRDIKGLLFPNNPLVVMSACQTGLGKVFEGGTFGLVRAWYHVGAPQIVMSLWNIDDNSTKDLMLEFMRRLKAGAATEFALREAMLATRQKYADPALWASVALFGLPSKVSRQPDRAVPRVALPQALPTPRTMMVPQGPAQRAVLYEEEAQNPGGRRFTGSVVWGTALAPGVDRRDVELRGEITIPERKLQVAWSLRRNSDPTLPASHVLELSFAVRSEVGGGGVQNVPGIMVKDSEDARGAVIVGMSVKVSAGHFLIGLSANDVLSNQALLKEGRWFDIPIVYEGGGRAILAIEKGSPGELAFGEVFASWSTIP
jgi:CHAT domain-containing protein